MKVSADIQDKNALILLETMRRYGKERNSEFADCSQIAYYVNDELIFRSLGEVMINRRDRYPKLQIIKPVPDNYTDTFQENSCIFTEMFDINALRIENYYTPYFLGKEVRVVVLIVFNTP